MTDKYRGVKRDANTPMTGEVDPRTKAKEVCLTEDGLAVTGVTDPIEGCDAVTPDGQEELV